jgi:hypothetical protein
VADVFKLVTILGPGYLFLGVRKRAYFISTIGIFIRVVFQSEFSISLKQNRIYKINAHVLIQKTLTA